MCGGPSQQQQSIAAQQQAFYSTLQQGYAQNFAGQQNILNSLQKSFAPILSAGINQYGFSAAEDASMRSQATSGVAQQYASAARATNANLAAVGGGNQFLPSGGAAQLQQQAALSAAGTEASEQQNITQAGYAQGRQNYLAAAGQLGSVAQQQNPLGYAGQATTAGQDAYGSAKQNATQAAQMWESIGGMVGGLATSALGAGIGLPGLGGNTAGIQNGPGSTYEGNSIG